MSEPKQPRGLSRLAFRLPIWLFHAHLGWIMGHRFVLVSHIGRKSGQTRQTVLEIVRYDQTSGACIVASGWGMKSDWVKNITANPGIVYQVQSRQIQGVAERLPVEQGTQELLNYAHHHPIAFRELSRFMGYMLNGSDEERIRAMVRTLPMFALKPETGNLKAQKLLVE